MPGTNPAHHAFLEHVAAKESRAIQLADLIFRACRVADQQRRSPRFPVSGLFGICRDGVDPKQRLVAVEITDLGFGGAGLRSSAFLQPGSTLRLDIEDDDAILRLEPCVVCWAEADRDGSYRAGVSFDWLSAI